MQWLSIGMYLIKFMSGSWSSHSYEGTEAHLTHKRSTIKSVARMKNFDCLIIKIFDEAIVNTCL